MVTVGVRNVPRAGRDWRGSLICVGLVVLCSGCGEDSGKRTQTPPSVVIDSQKLNAATGNPSGGGTGQMNGGAMAAMMGGRGGGGGGGGGAGAAGGGGQLGSGLMELVTGPPPEKTFPVPLEAGVALLSPGNVSLSMVASKPSGESYDVALPTASGKITVDEKTREVLAVSLEVKLDGLKADESEMATKLKSADFLDVAKFPLAKFESTVIEDLGDGEFSVSGKLTLHGQTVELQFPAQFKVSRRGIRANTRLTLDRTQFGIKHQIDEYSKEVTVAIDVAERGRPRRRRRSSGLAFNVEDGFQAQDKDGDGKLTGDEIPFLIRGADTNNDGTVTKEEATKFAEEELNRRDDARDED